MMRRPTNESAAIAVDRAGFLPSWPRRLLSRDGLRWFAVTLACWCSTAAFTAQPVNARGITAEPTVDVLAQADLRVIDSHPRSDSAVGAAVAVLGDVNRDGVPDYAVGDPGRDGPGVDSGGSVFVIFGARRGRVVDVAGSRGVGYRIWGAPGDAVGGAVAAAGDVNGDGVPDVLIGASSARNNGGAAYVVYGRPRGGDVDLRSLTPAQGFRVDGTPGDPPGDSTDGVPTGGPTGDFAGESVAGIGDLNKDGRADILVSTLGDNGGKGPGAYVIYGGSYSGPLELSHLGSRGYCVCGVSVDTQFGGLKVSRAGDVNGDGIPDLIIGSNNAGGPSGGGAAYVVYGRRSSRDVDVNYLGRRGFTVEAHVAGKSVSAAGDVNGDGIDDVIIGGNLATVFFGSRHQGGARYSLTRPGRHGFSIRSRGGVETVGSAGDFNHDGRADVLVSDIGASPYGRDTTGAVYLVYGKTTTAPVQAELLRGKGFRIVGDRGFGAFGSNGLDHAALSGKRSDDLIIASEVSGRGGEVDIFDQNAPPRVEISPAAATLRRHSSRVTVPLLCPATTRRLCAATVRLKTRGGRLLATRRFRVRAGDIALETLTLSSLPTSVRVTVDARSADRKRAHTERVMAIRR